MISRNRSQRVAEMIREEIAQLLAKGLKDPRIGFVSVTHVRMTPDLHYANVYVSLFGNESARKGSLAGLQSSSGWIRRVIAKKIRMRYTPEVRFFEDTTLDEVFRLEEIFRQIHSDEGPRESAAEQP